MSLKGGWKECVDNVNRVEMFSRIRLSGLGTHLVGRMADPRLHHMADLEKRTYAFPVIVDDQGAQRRTDGTIQRVMLPVPDVVSMH